MIVLMCFSAALAFTVQGLYPSSSTDIRFMTVLLNDGGGYSTTTGIFTCSVPGLYWFSAALTKALREKVGDMGNKLSCYIMFNGNTGIEMYADPVDKNEDGLTISGSLALHLNRGDKVQVGNCKNAGSFGNFYSTYFSGVLVRPNSCL